MKISVIITTILVAQVSASFFDVFHGAVLSVQNSFGKLLSDVVTDVKDTVDCTILAVEHVLSLSHDATIRYYEKCGSVTNKTDSVSNARQDASLPKVEVTLNLPNHEEYLQKVIPTEIDARINETLSKVLGNYKSHDSILSIENVLAKESEQPAGVSDLVKKELQKLSSEVTTDLKNIEKQRDLQPSIDGILQEIRVLEKRELNTKNTSEANEINKVIDDVLGKLDAIEATEATENIKLEEILKGLEWNSNNSFVGLRHQFEEWKEEESIHLSEIKSKMEEHEKISDHLGSYNRHGSNLIQPVIFNTDSNIDGAESTKKSQVISSDNTTQVKKTLDNSMSSRTIGDSNDKSLISVTNEPSLSQNRLNESGLNETVKVSSSYSTTEIQFSRDLIYQMVVGTSELLTVSSNQSATPQNNLTGDGTNETVVNIRSVTDSAPVNETIQLVYFLTDLDKRESTSMSTNKPRTMLSANENKSNETVIISSSLLATETLGDISQPVSVEINTDSKKNESFDLFTNNGSSKMVIKSAAERTEAELRSQSQDSLNNDNSNRTAKISIIANTMVENTTVKETNFENLNSSTLATNVFGTTLVTYNINESKDITSTPSSINVSVPVNAIQPVEYSTTLSNEESSTVTTKIVHFNESKITNTSLFTKESTLVSEIIQPVETTTASSKEESSMTIVHDNNLNETIIAASTPIIESINVSETASGSVEFTTVTKQIMNYSDSNNIMITSDYSSPIVENSPVSKTIEPEKTTMTSYNEKSSNGSDGTMITSSPLSTIETTPVYETIQPKENNTTSSNEKSTEAITELTTISKIVNENDSPITSMPTPIISESETIQAIYTTTVSTSEEESINSTTSSPTETPNTADNDSRATTITSTSASISKSISEDNIMTTESEEPSTTYSPIYSLAKLITTDSNADIIIISTPFPMTEMIAVSDKIEPVVSTTPTENEEPSILSTTILDEVIKENTDSNYTVTITTEKTESAVVTGTIQTVETTSTSEKKDLSTSTQSAINENVTTSTEISIMAFRNKDDLRNLSKLEAKEFSRTTKILNSPDLNFMIRSPPLTITESPVKRGWLNPEVPMYGQTALPPITRGLFNDSSISIPDKLIPNVSNQQPKIENDALQKPAFDIFDSIDKRSPFGPDKDILKIANVPSTPLITNVPWKPIDPQRMNYENPTNVPTSMHRIRPPYSFGDRDPAYTYRPQGLTTQRPGRTAARTSNYKTTSMDYDSFFHIPQNDSEAHQRALQEARQLIANSRRSRRIINNIMKNKNKYNARSVFNG